MRIQYASDLHLEFPENESYFYASPFEVHGEILVLAGDIVPFARLSLAKEFFEKITERFRKVYWVPGNHEYYHSDIFSRCGELSEEVFPNVFLVNNITVVENEVELIFSTMWTDIGSSNADQVARRMADFKIIKYNGITFTPHLANMLHKQSIEFISAALSSSSGKKKVVISHHVPTFLRYPAQYLGDVLNEAFAVELQDVILEKGPDYWIFGHHHSNVGEFKIGKTHLLTNQLGYIRYGENIGYSKNAVIEL